MSKLENLKEAGRQIDRKMLKLAHRREMIIDQLKSMGAKELTGTTSSARDSLDESTQDTSADPYCK